MEEQRLADLNFLNRYYDSGLSNILVVYGHRNIDHNVLLQKFVENRRNFFYMARSASEKEQRFLWANELREKGINIDKNPDFKGIFEACLLSSGRNDLIFVIRNFEYIVKNSDAFMKELTEFVTKHGKQRQILVLLVSHDINWVENSMVASLGSLAGNIAGFRKIKPLSFSEMRNHFSKMSYKDAVMTYAVLGGQTMLWKFFDDSLSFKENICKNFIDGSSYLREEALRLTAYHLRETAVYHTLLSQMARGTNKLNDLYHETGFSRAKISVYLKTLIHHDFAYKAYSFGNAGRENVVKGVYKIADPLVDFYFRFIYPNLSDLIQMPSDKFYDIFISAGMQSYVNEYFKKVCREYILKLEERGLFPFEVGDEGQWLGKDGNIDIILQSDMGDTALGVCKWQEQITHSDLDRLYATAKKARLEGDIIYLFSTSGFDAWLTDAAMKSSGKLKLIGIDELTNG
ncbi:MAG: ATP-binding protein [Butyrivibrio sp.]|nr:ATP-binding protein [Butyrivibrio sp.]